MTKSIHPLALFRLTVLGPLASRDHLSPGELKQVLTSLAEKSYMTPAGLSKQFSAKAIERWYYCWRQGGVDALAPQKRCDRGQSKISVQLKEQLLEAKRAHPSRSIKTLIHLLETEGHVPKNVLTRSSVHRLLQHHGLSKRGISEPNSIERRSFVALHANDIWYGDVMHGPKVSDLLGTHKAYLISFMDDTSRLICHSGFYLSENSVCVEQAFKEALLKRGLPKKLVVDNGSAYRSSTLQEICARLKIRLIFCRPYEPEGKGKLERWHRSVREIFLSELSLSMPENRDDLNARLWVWIEKHYHQQPHAGLKGDTPVQCWLNDLKHIQRLGEIAPQIDDYFLHRHERLVRKDGTVNYAGKTYEVAFEHAGRNIMVSVDPSTDLPKYAEFNEQCFPIFPLDRNANLNRSRQRHQSTNIHPSENNKRNLIDAIYEKAQRDLNLNKKNNDGGK
jgi:putative transposase